MADVILEENPSGHCAPSDRWEAAGGVRVRFRRDPAGDVYDGWRVDGAIRGEALRTPGAALASSMAAARTAASALETKLAANRARLDVLASRAARFAKDPVANAGDQLTARLQHEFLARLWLAERTDDV